MADRGGRPIRTIAIAAASLVLIVLGAIVVMFVVAGPTPSEEPVDADLNSTAVYGRLVTLGVEDAVVDANDERVLVRYNRDGNENVTTADVAIIAAEVYPNTPRIVIQVFESFEPHEQTTVQTEIATALARGEITEEEFETAANTTRLT